MAKNNNLTDFLTDLANTIRTKKGYASTVKLNPQNFASEINTIKTGVTTISANANLSLTYSLVSSAAAGWTNNATPSASSTKPTAPIRGVYGYYPDVTTNGKYANGKFTFTAPTNTIGIIVTVFQSSEAGYDYAGISKIDATFENNTTIDSDAALKYSTKSLNGFRSYIIPCTAGSHFITMKYKTDGSNLYGYNTCVLTGICAIIGS